MPTNLLWEPTGARCFVCGHPNPHGWHPLWVGGRGYIDYPCCANGEGHMQAVAA